jgi:phosphatidylglycerol---prolipoprotein diacylglyceryl transferase
VEESNHVHNLSGFFPKIPLGEGSYIPTYFVIISFAFCVCLYWLVKRAEARALSRNTALDLSLLVMGFGFLGARLFHVFFEAPSVYAAEPLRVFEFWSGGFVWYGGAIVAAAAGSLYVRRRSLRLGVWLDLFAPVAALGYALGRMACVLAGCCYGSVCTLATGLSFRYPTQIFSVAWELGVLALLVWLEKKRKTRGTPLWLQADGRIFAVWLTLHALGRIAMEIFRDDPRGPMPFDFSLATWISLLLLAGLLKGTIFPRRNQKP